MSEASERRAAKRAGRRRRRARGERGRGFLLLPHLFTTGNLFFGFYAIVQATMGNPDLAALGIVLAGVFDLFDGRIARMANATSKFGAEYDSIADTVSFGVAPAMLAFSAGNLAALGRPGWVMAFIYTACAALRLARFNVAQAKYAGRFEGLPSPGAALMVASTQWFVSFLRENGIVVQFPEYTVAAGVAILGLLMVSSVPYRTFKEIDLRHSFGTLVFTILVLAVMAQEPKVTLFAISVAGVCSGPVEWAWRRIAGKPLEPAAAEPAEEALP